MKLNWHCLLITLCCVFPFSVSISLAETKTPYPVSEKTSETTSKPSSEEKPQQKDPQPQLTPEEITRHQKLIDADQLFLGGQYAAAEKLYREVKPAFAKSQPQSEQKPPITDAENLPPAGKVFWRQSQQGLEQKLETKIFVPLELLVKQYPEFIPGYLRYVQALKDYNRADEAFAIIEKATILYPNQPDLLKLKITALGEKQKWLEASLAARQFALLNPNNSAVDEFTKLADDNLKRYQSHLRAKLRGNAIANIITGAVGYAVTGSIWGPLSAVQTTALLLRGESSVGKSVANQAKRELTLIEDEEVLNYVKEIGKKLATVAGRKDFTYEFYVVKDEKINAFALPGGKVFVNAGAILKTHSEAELAGLMAHELSHAVLSHGFQLMTEGSLTANISGLIPYSGIIGNLLVLNYSRDMERQADVLGTRLLVSTGYAADGMYNLMVILNKEEHHQPVFSWLSTHPVTNQRISYLENLISTNGYNRYQYEGVARHAQIQARLKKLLEKPKKDQIKPQNKK